MFLKLSLWPSLGVCLWVLVFLCFGGVVPFFFVCFLVGNDLYDEIIHSENSPELRLQSNLNLELKLHVFLHK